MARFLTARRGSELLWTCIDPLSLCSAPVVAPRRFAAYLAPFVDEAAARQALIEAGANPKTLTDEQRHKRARGRRG